MQRDEYSQSIVVEEKWVEKFTIPDFKPSYKAIVFKSILLMKKRLDK